ncbi:MAG TPA: class I SAM-dependent methyltransferase [Chlamydiales bacterium]|nr:class I SAM-dependent methyltransferase [Chlamydiales bacterium]
MKSLFLVILVSFFPIKSQGSIDFLKFKLGLSRSLSPFEDYLERKNVYNVYQDKVAGHITDAQKFQMNEALATYSNIKAIGEIGLNLGHSTDNFFNNCKEIEKYYSFDVNFISEVVEYFRDKYKSQFHFFQGDSLQTVPEFTRSFPTIKLDLIFIDGGHSYDQCLNDILNMQALAHENTHLWIDDYLAPEVFEAVESCKKIFGILEIVKVHVSDFKTSAERCWVEARYLFPEKDLDLLRE